MFFREAVDTRALLAAMAATTTDAATARRGVPRLRRPAPRHAAPGPGRNPHRRRGGRAALPGTGRLRPLPLDSPLAATLAGRFDTDGDRTRPARRLGARAAAGGPAVAGRRRRPPGDAAALAGRAGRGDGARREVERPAVLRRRPGTAGAGGRRAGPQDREPAIARRPRRNAWTRRRRADGPATRRAVVCVRCTFVTAADDRCVRCGGDVVPSQLPAVLAGKFRLERELGRGGMGVVYLAFDTALERRSRSRRCRGCRWPNRCGCAARRGRWPASPTRTWR